MRVSPTRKTLHWLFLLFSAVGIAACGDTQYTAQEHVQRAKEYQEKGQQRSAVLELKNALQREPTNVEARLLLGRTHAASGNWPAAEKELNRARELGAQDGAFQPWLARALLNQGKHHILSEMQIPSSLSNPVRAELLAAKAEAAWALNRADHAEAMLNRAVAVQADSAAVMTSVARIRAAQGDLDVAREWASRATTVDEDYAAAWNVLGAIAQLQGELHTAEEAYTKAIQDPRTRFSSLLGRSLVRIKLEDYEQASKDIEALRRIPGTKNHPGANYAEGLLNYSQKRFTEALPLFEAAHNLEPDHLPTIFYLGATHFFLGNPASAETYLSGYLVSQPGDLSAKRLLAMVEMQAGNPAEAEKLARQIMEHASGDYLTLNILANTLIGQGKQTEGIGYLQRAADSQPESPVARTKLGAALLGQGEQDKGIEELERALELAFETEDLLQKRHAQVVLILGYVKTGEFDKALAEAQRLSAQNPDDPHPYLILGLIHQQMGSTEKAEAAFQSALELSPGYPPAAQSLAVLSKKAGDLKAARAYYAEILKHHPGHLSTLISLAHLESSQGRVDAAIKLLEQAVTENPTSLSPRLILGTYYFRAGMPKRTLELFESMRGAYPDNAELLALIGQAQLAAGEPQAAVSTFQQLTQVVPRSAQAHYYLAMAYEGTGQYGRMEKAVSAALANNPKHDPSRIAQLRLLGLQQKKAEASQLLKELKAEHPNHPEILAQEGWFALKQGQARKAAALLEQSYRISPRNRATMLLLAEAQAAAGDLEARLSTLEGWSDRHPGDLEVKFRLANTYAELGRLSDAKKHLGEVVQQRPRHPAFLNNYAWLLRKDDPEQALEYAERALRAAPDTPGVMDTLAVILLEQGETDRAVSLLISAVEKAPQNRQLRYHLAQALIQQGNKQEARGELQTLLQQKGAFRDEAAARELLATLQ